MPTVLFVNGYRFYFFSNENNEPPHIHVERAEANSKYWINPIVTCVYSYGFTSKQEKEVEKIIKSNVDLFIKKWNEYFK